MVLLFISSRKAIKVLQQAAVEGYAVEFCRMATLELLL